MTTDTRMSRRTFINTATVASLTLTLPRLSAATSWTLEKPIQIGVIADLHHDVMHDGLARTAAFVKAMVAINVASAVRGDKRVFIMWGSMAILE